MTDMRTANLASLFQEVLTAIVRVRFRIQQVQDAESFRSQIRNSLQPPMQKARSLGYSGDHIQGAVFGVIALLDESVLNLQDPIFVNWAKRPLQEELFGGHLAGETFFKNLRGYLAQQDSPQLADVLELHCLCLLLGYRGRYALADSGELQAIVRLTRERIQRIRGSVRLLPINESVAQGNPPKRLDKWNRYLLWTSCALACLLVIAFVSYHFVLSSGVSALYSSTLNVS
jgi:type VI secretion system protein ImpK